MHFSTIRSVLLASQYINDEGGILYFNPTEAMIQNTIDLPLLKKMHLQKNNNEYLKAYKNIDIDDTQLEQCFKEHEMYSRRKRKHEQQPAADMSRKPKLKKSKEQVKINTNNDEQQIPYEGINLCIKIIIK